MEKCNFEELADEKFYDLLLDNNIEVNDFFITSIIDDFILGSSSDYRNNFNNINTHARGEFIFRKVIISCTLRGADL